MVYVNSGTSTINVGMTEDGTGENRQLRGEPEADGPQVPSPSNSRSEPSGQVRARNVLVRRQRSPAASPGRERVATGGCPVRVGGARSSRGHSERTRVSATEKQAARRGQAEAGGRGAGWEDARSSQPRGPWVHLCHRGCQGEQWEAGEICLCL